MKFKKGLVSAIIPTFNRLEMLKERIEEMKFQSYKNWELIIVDDASTDGTREFLNSIKDEKIKSLSLEKNSRSVSIPRNIGICMSVGEFIAPTDDDVFILPEKLSVLVNEFEDDCVLVYGDRLEKTGDKILYPPQHENWNPKITHGVDNSQIIYRANVYEKLPLIFPTKACDWHTAKHIADLGRIKHVNYPVSIYEWHEKNRSHNKNKINISPNEYESYYKNYMVDYSDIYN